MQSLSKYSKQIQQQQQPFYVTLVQYNLSEPVLSQRSDLQIISPQHILQLGGQSTEQKLHKELFTCCSGADNSLAKNEVRLLWRQCDLVFNQWAVSNVCMLFT